MKIKLLDRFNGYNICNKKNLNGLDLTGKDYTCKIQKLWIMR